MPSEEVKRLVESWLIQAGKRPGYNSREEGGRVEEPDGKKSERTSHVPRCHYLREYQDMSVIWYSNDTHHA